MNAKPLGPRKVRCLYSVTLWLADQTTWRLTGTITGDSEQDALINARNSVADCWPALADAIVDAPGIASLMPSISHGGGKV